MATTSRKPLVDPQPTAPVPKPADPKKANPLEEIVPIPPNTHKNVDDPMKKILGVTGSEPKNSASTR